VLFAGCTARRGTFQLARTAGLFSSFHLKLLILWCKRIVCDWAVCYLVVWFRALVVLLTNTYSSDRNCMSSYKLSTAVATVGEPTAIAACCNNYISCKSLPSIELWCLQEKELKDARDLIRRMKTEHVEQYAELETLKVSVLCSLLCWLISHIFSTVHVDDKKTQDMHVYADTVCSWRYVFV